MSGRSIKSMHQSYMPLYEHGFEYAGSSAQTLIGIFRYFVRPGILITIREELEKLSDDESRFVFFALVEFNLIDFKCFPLNNYSTMADVINHGIGFNYADSEILPEQLRYLEEIVDKGVFLDTFLVAAKKVNEIKGLRIPKKFEQYFNGKVNLPLATRLSQVEIM